MDPRKAFGMALKAARKYNNLSQEDFSDVSSRTYISSLERGQKSPTLDKIQQLSERMNIHPMTLLAIAYLRANKRLDCTALMERICDEASHILK